MSADGRVNMSAIDRPCSSEFETLHKLLQASVHQDTKDYTRHYTLYLRLNHRDLEKYCYTVDTTCIIDLSFIYLHVSQCYKQSCAHCPQWVFPSVTITNLQLALRQHKTLVTWTAIWVQASIGLEICDSRHLTSTQFLWVKAIKRDYRMVLCTCLFLWLQLLVFTTSASLVIIYKTYPLCMVSEFQA